jgi:hypothetical protein
MAVLLLAAIRESSLLKKTYEISNSVVTTTAAKP